MAEATRRSVLNWLLNSSAGALAASILYPIARFVSPPETPEASTHQLEAGPTNDPELIEKGFKILRFGSEPVILVRAADGDFRAFAATCTHLDCIVEYHPDQHRLWCNCHNGEYNLQGQVVAGPPPRPLPAFRVDLVDAGTDRARTIVVTRV